MMSPAGCRHGRIALKLSRCIGGYVEEYKLGETFAVEAGFLVTTNPDVVRAPDLTFVSTETLGDYSDHPGYCLSSRDWLGR